MTILLRVFLLCFLLIMTNRAPAQEHADIEIEIDNGRLVTEPRIGEAEFGESPNPANTADEPGFEADDGVLVDGDEIGVNAVELLGSNLWHWNGIGDVDFAASPTSMTVQHPVTSQSMTLRSEDSVGVPGFTIGFADTEGGLHQDLEFVLTDMTPEAGVYLFGLEMTSPAYASSDPIYMVLASEIDEQAHEAAVDWVATTFSVPEPNFAYQFYLLIGAVALWNRVRSRSAYS